ncbi:hypothetical protein BOX15_Mlig005260g3 [Macrostomum lignano]|uniref:Mpv17-like protein 2 n=1 Tax=Macrostomum lignano TaxID=282301 RepID=A0A267FWB4_9PLAT|nr:hypothetical protein BOX15_Mlig005260g3 [Macrostomum lignano]
MTAWRRAADALKRFHELAYSPRYLLLTNLATAPALLSIGDLAAQKLEQRLGSRPVGPIDWSRTKRIYIVGLLLATPQHFWYVLLDHRLPGRAGRTIVKKILMDQIGMGIGINFCFFLLMPLLEGRTPAQAWETACRKFPTAYLADWLVWPPAQAVNFYFLPPKYRILYLSFITAFWDFFLSFYHHRQAGGHQHQLEEGAEAEKVKAH